SRQLHERSRVDLLNCAPARAHEAATVATALGLDELSVPEATEGFTHRDNGDAHERRELCLTRQPLPLGKCANGDRLHQPRLYKLGAPLLTNGRKGSGPQTAGRGLRKR